MSSLDSLYKNFKIYCQDNPVKHTKVYELHLYTDGTGEIVLLDYLGTESNPFKVARETILTWETISNAVIQLEEKIRGQKTVPKGKGRQSNKRNMAEVQSPIGI